MIEGVTMWGSFLWAFIIMFAFTVGSVLGLFIGWRTREEEVVMFRQEVARLSERLAHLNQRALALQKQGDTLAREIEHGQCVHSGQCGEFEYPDDDDDFIIPDDDTFCFPDDEEQGPGPRFSIN